MKNRSDYDSPVMRELARNAVATGVVKPLEKAAAPLLKQSKDMMVNIVTLADNLRARGMIAEAESLESKYLMFKVAETHLYKTHEDSLEDMLGMAHGQDPVVSESKGGYGVVEGLVSAHKKNVDIAMKKPMGKNAAILDDVAGILGVKQGQAVAAPENVQNINLSNDEKTGKLLNLKNKMIQYIESAISSCPKELNVDILSSITISENANYQYKVVFDGPGSRNYESIFYTNSEYDSIINDKNYRYLKLYLSLLGKTEYFKKIIQNKTFDNNTKNKLLDVFFNSDANKIVDNNIKNSFNDSSGTSTENFCKKVLHNLNDLNINVDTDVNSIKQELLTKLINIQDEIWRYKYPSNYQKGFLDNIDQETIRWIFSNFNDYTFKQVHGNLTNISGDGSRNTGLIGQALSLLVYGKDSEKFNEKPEKQKNNNNDPREFIFNKNNSELVRSINITADRFKRVSDIAKSKNNTLLSNLCLNVYIYLQSKIWGKDWNVAKVALKDIFKNSRYQKMVQNISQIHGNKNSWDLLSIELMNHVKKASSINYFENIIKLAGEFEIPSFTERKPAPRASNRNWAVGERQKEYEAVLTMQGLISQFGDAVAKGDINLPASMDRNKAAAILFSTGKKSRTAEDPKDGAWGPQTAKALQLIGEIIEANQPKGGNQGSLANSNKLAYTSVYNSILKISQEASSGIITRKNPYGEDTPNSTSAPSPGGIIFAPQFKRNVNRQTLTEYISKVVDAAQANIAVIGKFLGKKPEELDELFNRIQSGNASKNRFNENESKHNPNYTIKIGDHVLKLSDFNSFVAMAKFLARAGRIKHNSKVRAIPLELFNGKDGPTDYSGAQFSLRNFFDALNELYKSAEIQGSPVFKKAIEEFSTRAKSVLVKFVDDISSEFSKINNKNTNDKALIDTYKMYPSILDHGTFGSVAVSGSDVGAGERGGAGRNSDNSDRNGYGDTGAQRRYPRRQMDRGSRYSSNGADGEEVPGNKRNRNQNSLRMVVNDDLSVNCKYWKIMSGKFSAYCPQGIGTLTTSILNQNPSSFAPSWFIFSEDDAEQQLSSMGVNLESMKGTKAYNILINIAKAYVASKLISYLKTQIQTTQNNWIADIEDDKPTLAARGEKNYHRLVQYMDNFIYRAQSTVYLEQQKLDRQRFRR